MSLHVWITYKLNSPRLDRQGMDNNNEFVEPISFVKFIDGMRIDVCLARTRFHLDVEIQHTILCRHHLAVIGLQFLRVFYTTESPFGRYVLMINKRVLVWLQRSS